MDNFLLKLIDFYTPYFDSQKLAMEFIEECRKYVPTLRCCHQIQRLIGQTSKAPTYPFNSDCIQIFFWVVCIESLHDRAGIKNIGKAQMVRNFIDGYISDNDKDFLAKNLRHSSTGEPANIAKLLNDIRNQFAHEGTYWMFNLNSELETDSMIVIGPKKEGFEVTMTIKQMRDIIVRGTIQFLKEQIKQLNQEP